jgi:hypothetical protein
MKENAQVDRMREHLREFHVQDPEARLFTSLLRQIEDPLRPRDENGRLRLNPILLLLALILVLAAGTFLFFSFGGL